MKTVRINRHGAQRAANGHPWIFGSDVTDRGGAESGDAVIVADHKGRPIGAAHYSSTSQISLRILSAGVEEPDAAFFAQRLSRAAAHRQRVVEGSNAYRLVHAEGDLLPGLIVDWYAGACVVQTLNQGMDRVKPVIVEQLTQLTSADAVVERNDSSVRARESLPLTTGVLHGELTGPVMVEMNGLRLQADLLAGQKTGIYLDQRENYIAAKRYARGEALDCFTSTGGFALHIAPRCERVTAVDSSHTALATARLNAAANNIDNIEFVESNVFDLLASYSAARRKFTTIILDPPAFAKARSGLDGATRGYKEINLRALKLLDPGGVLVSCSCSHHVSEAMLLEIIAEAALDAGRTLRVLERRTQAQDHPILLTVPETHYLKCLIFEVL